MGRVGRRCLPAAPLIAGFFGTSPAARFMPPTSATPHAHSFSTCGQRSWDDELAEAFRDSRLICPAPDFAVLGNIRGNRTVRVVSGAGIPIASMIGDSHAALFGQCGFLPGSIKATYGTGSSLMTPIQELRISEPRSLLHRRVGTQRNHLCLGRQHFSDRLRRAVVRSVSRRRGTGARRVATLAQEVDRHRWSLRRAGVCWTRRPALG